MWFSTGRTLRKYSLVNWFVYIYLCFTSHVFCIFFVFVLVRIFILWWKFHRWWLCFWVLLYLGWQPAYSTYSTCINNGAVHQREKGGLLPWKWSWSKFFFLEKVNRFLLTITYNLHHEIPCTVIKPVPSLNWLHTLSFQKEECVCVGLGGGRGRTERAWFPGSSYLEKILTILFLIVYST